MASCSALILLLSLFQSESQHATTIPETTLQRVLADIQRVQLTKDILWAEYDSLVGDVATIKVSRELGLLRRMKLKRLLRRSEDLAQQIAKLERVIALQSSAAQNRMKPAIGQLESLVLTLLQQSPARLPDSNQVRVMEWMIYRSVMIDFVRRSGGQRLDMSLGRLPQVGSDMEKANLAGDAADRLRQYENELLFELDRIAFMLQLRTFYDRIDRHPSDPSWLQVRAWIDTGPAEARLPLNGSTLRWRDNLSVRQYLLQAELQAARAAAREWRYREKYWREQYARASRDADDLLY